MLSSLPCALRQVRGSDGDDDVGDDDGDDDVGDDDGDDDDGGGGQ